MGYIVGKVEWQHSLRINTGQGLRRGPAPGERKANTKTRGGVGCIVGEGVMQRVDPFNVGVMPRSLNVLAFLVRVVVVGHLPGTEYD